MRSKSSFFYFLVFFQTTFSLSQVILPVDEYSQEINRYESIPDFTYSQPLNHISYDLLSFMIGDYSVYYERVPSANYGIEVGLGVTGTNLLREMFKGMSQIVLNEFQGVKEINTPGSTFKIAYKYYPKSMAPGGGYVQLQYAFRQYNSTFNFDQAYRGKNDSDLKGSRINNEIRLIFGKSAYFGNSRVLSGVFAGFGLKYMVYDQLDYSDSLGEYYLKPYNMYFFAIYIGWKIGFAY